MGGTDCSSYKHRSTIEKRGRQTASANNAGTEREDEAGSRISGEHRRTATNPATLQNSKTHLSSFDLRRPEERPIGLDGDIELADTHIEPQNQT